MASKQGTGEHVAVVCPECGRRSDDRSRIPIPSLFHWRRTVPAGIAFLASISFAIWLASTPRTGTIGSGSAVAMLIDPPFTREQLESIAATNSSSAKNLLIEAVLNAIGSANDRAPGERHLDIGLVDGQGTRARSASIGWPSPWAWEWEYRQYDDAAARSGFRPGMTNPVLRPLGNGEFPRNLEDLPPRPRWALNATSLVHQPPPEETGGAYVTRGVDFKLIVPFAAAIILGWLLVWLAVCLINRFRKNANPIHGRAAKLAAATIAVIAVLMTGILAGEETDQFTFGPFGRGSSEQHGRPPGKVYWTRRDYARPGLTVRDLEMLEHSAGADQIVAEKFLEALDRIPESPMRSQRPAYLSVAADTESMYLTGRHRTFNEKFFAFSTSEMQFFRRGDLGPMDLLALPRGISLHYRFGYLSIYFSSGNPDALTRRITIHVMSVGMIILAMWLLWLLARWSCSGVHVAIVHHRRRTRRCAGCGYILAA